jgi:hypothetical protein
LNHGGTEGTEKIREEKKDRIHRIYRTGEGNGAAPGCAVAGNPVNPVNPVCSGLLFSVLSVSPW